MERYAQVFAIYLFLLTDVGFHYFQNKTKQKVNAKYPHSYESFLHLVENTLIIYQWIIQPEFPKILTEEVEKNVNVNGRRTRRKVIPGQEIIKGFMTEMKELIIIVKSWEFPKFHQLLHPITHYIPRFGSWINVDGAPREALFKSIIKGPARRTQRKNDTLAFQTANRFTERVIFRRAYKRCNWFKGNVSVSKKQTRLSEIPEGMVSMAISRNASRFSMKKDTNEQNEPSMRITWHTPSPTKDYTDDIYKELWRLVFSEDLHMNEIQCFTELQIDGDTIRGHPSYRSGLPWYDWVYIRWQGITNPLPAKVFMFVSLDPQRNIKDLNKVYAIVQSTSRMCRRTHPRLRNIQTVAGSSGNR